MKNSDVLAHFKALPEHELNQGMPIFTCSCGERILIIPDLQGMKKAINNHIKEHNSAGQQVREDELTQVILKVLSGL
jgi:hypothetical protein